MLVLSHVLPVAADSETSRADQAPVCLFFLIRSLNIGGAERQLIELVRSLDTARYRIVIVTFYDGGSLRHELEQCDDVAVFSLGKRGRWDLVSPIRRLLRLLRTYRPQILHGYASEPNVLALLVGRFFNNKIVWGIRRSSVDLTKLDSLSRVTQRLGSLLSHGADLVIYNSEAGKRQHLAHGYCAARAIVIQNGIDIRRFAPDAAARQRQRAEWGLAEGEFAIGLVGRLNPVKDHPTFLRAAALFHQQYPSSRFICIGPGTADYQEELQALAAKLAIADRVLWVGGGSVMPMAYNALDLCALCSVDEGFPNVVGEAMACGIPCIVTDVGDASLIVDIPECVIPPRDPQAMAAAWVRLARLSYEERTCLGQQGRKRITQEFTPQALARKTQTAFEALLK